MNSRNTDFITLNETINLEGDNFEPLVDLLTLLSLALIVATFLFGHPQSDASETSIQVVSELREVKTGTLPTPGIPEDTILLVNTLEDEKSTVYIIESGKTPEVIFSGDIKISLWDVLEEKKNAFMTADDIQIVVSNAPFTANAELLLNELSWLAQYSLSATINFDNNYGRK